MGAPLPLRDRLRCCSGCRCVKCTTRSRRRRELLLLSSGRCVTQISGRWSVVGMHALAGLVEAAADGDGIGPAVGQRGPEVDLDLGGLEVPFAVDLDVLVVEAGV